MSNFWLVKIRLFTWRPETLVPFKVVPSVMHILLPGVPPLLETLLERIFWKGIQLGLRIPRVFSWMKSGEKCPLSGIWEQPKIACRGSREPDETRNAVLGQESLNQVRRMNRCVIVTTRRALVTLPHLSVGCQRLTLSTDGKISRIHMNVLDISSLKDASRASFAYTGKVMFRFFFQQTSYLYMCIMFIYMYVYTYGHHSSRRSSVNTGETQK